MIDPVRWGRKGGVFNWWDGRGALDHEKPSPKLVTFDARELALVYTGLANLGFTDDEISILFEITAYEELSNNKTLALAKVAALQVVTKKVVTKEDAHQLIEALDWMRQPSFETNLAYWRFISKIRLWWRELWS